MKKVLKSRNLIPVLLFILLILAFSIYAYSRSHTVSKEMEECCQKPESNGSSEMLWDVLSRQIVSAVRM